MLTKKEKELQYLSFIKSKQFGLDTYKTLSLCLSNVNYGVRTVDLYWTLIEKIDLIQKFDFPKQELNVKQHVALDMIIKTQVMIETIFVLIDALSKGYSGVSKQITRYNNRLPKEIIIQIRLKKYNLYKIIQLPEIQTLDLSSEENKFLETAFKRTIDLVWSRLLRFVDFYEKYYVVYLKTKHGLSIQTGGRLDNSDELDFSKSYLSALDHRLKNELHEDTFTAKRFSNVDSWYTVQSMVKFNDKFKNEIFSVVGDLFQIMSLIVESNLTYARNCGQVYLPVTRTSEKNIALFLLSENPYSDDESKHLKTIADKILSLMNTRDLSLSMTEKFGEKIQRSFKEDSVTTLYTQN